jgi:hypothetical protein
MNHKGSGWMIAIALAAGFLGGAAASLLTGADEGFAAMKSKAAPVVTAGEFRLVDGSGNTRASLALGDGDRPRLDLYDDAGRMRAGLYLLADGSPRLGLFSEGGMHRVLLAMLPGDQAGLVFFHEDGTPNASVMAKSGGKSEIVLGGPDGKILWSAP